MDEIRTDANGRKYIYNEENPTRANELESLRAQVETLQGRIRELDTYSGLLQLHFEQKKERLANSEKFNETLQEQNALLTLQAQQLAAALKPFCDGDVPDDDSPENYVMNAKAALSALTTYIQAADSVAVQEPVASQAEQVCAEAYQVVGSLLHDAGLFDSERATKILDNLSQARLVHTDVLPWAASPTLDKE